MKRLSAITIGLLVIAFTVTGCWMTYPDSQRWVTLIDGERGLENFNRYGDANWRAEGGAIVADKGKGGQLVSKKSYRDFELRIEFWAEPTAQSGIYLRCQDVNKITDRNCYEAQIYDQRPDQTYTTGALMHRVAAVSPPPRAGGKWNTYVIRAQGSHLTVVLNDVVTVNTQDSEFASGPFTLQFGNRGKEPGGAIKWRKVQIKEL